MLVKSHRINYLESINPHTIKLLRTICFPLGLFGYLGTFYFRVLMCVFMQQALAEYFLSSFIKK